MYIKLNAKNVVIQKQPYPGKGFKEAPDDVVCGQIKQSDGSFKNPPPVPSPPPTVEELLYETEGMAALAGKIEEIIDYIENGTPLSTQAKDWVATRKTIRG